MYLSHHIPSHGNILEKSIFVLSAIFLAIGILSTYVYTTISLSGTVKVTAVFWDSNAMLLSLINIINVIFIVLNAYNNFRYRNCFVRRPISNLGILFFICLPSLIIVLVGFLNSIIRDSYNVRCKGIGNIACAVTTFFLFVSVLIFILETNGLSDCGEFWIINFLNMATALLTIVNMIICVVFNIILSQTTVFLKVVKRSHPTYCTEQDPKYVLVAHSYLNPFLWRYQILLCVCCGAFLLSPLLRHLSQLQKYKIVFYTENTAESTITHSPSNLTVTCIALSFMVVLSIISLFLSNTIASIFDTIAHILIIVLYALLILVICILIKITKQWPYATQPRTFNDIINWIGLVGQVCYVVSMITIYASDSVEVNKWKQIICIIGYSMQACQNIFQSLLESIILSKDWQRIPLEYSSKIIHALLFIGIANYNFGLISIMYIPFDNNINKDLHCVQLFLATFGKMGRTFGILQRLHSGSIFLSVMYLMIS